MKKIIVLVFVAAIAISLFSIIDRTISIDTQLMQQIRQNLNQPYPDPLIGDYIRHTRNDVEYDPPDNSEERVVDLLLQT